MSDQPLYLFKGARRPLYRKENLHLLARFEALPESQRIAVVVALAVCSTTPSTSDPADDRPAAKPPCPAAPRPRCAPRDPPSPAC
jgi:hypothetical protein